MEHSVITEKNGYPNDKIPKLALR